MAFIEEPYKTVVIWQDAYDIEFYETVENKRKTGNR